MLEISKEIIKDFNSVIIGDGTPAKESLGSVLSSFHFYDNETDQVSSIVRGIIKNHAFLDGNKRTAVIVLFYLADQLKLNIVNDDELFKQIIEIASHNYEVDEISSRLFKDAT